MNGFWFWRRVITDLPEQVSVVDILVLPVLPAPWRLLDGVWTTGPGTFLCVAAWGETVPFFRDGIAGTAEPGPPGPTKLGRKDRESVAEDGLPQEEQEPAGAEP